MSGIYLCGKIQIIMNIPEKIIIHCSATMAGKDFSAADIDRWHRARGFRCISYHYVVDAPTTKRGRTVRSSR